MDRLNLTISASRVGEHYSHSCMRYTAYSLLRDPSKVGWDKRDMRSTALQEAGHIWEWDVLCSLEQEGISCYAHAQYSDPSRKAEPHWRVLDFAEMRELCDVYGNDRGRDAIAYADLSEATTIELLRHPEKYLSGYSQGQTSYIYQTTIGCPESFKNRFLLRNGGNRALLENIFSGRDESMNALWSICKPDLIMVTPQENGEPLFSVVDIKHAKHPKMGHKVQVAIYVELLSALLRDEKIPGRVQRGQGYLWNFKMDSPHSFELRDVWPWVQDYFENIMPEVLTTMRDCQRSGEKEAFNQSFFACPSQHCDFCDNFQACQRWQRLHEPVTLMPYLSVYAQKYLRLHQVPLDVEGFAKYVSSPAREEKLKQGCLGLKRILQSKQENLEALRRLCEPMGGEALLRPNLTYMAMPRSEGIRVIFTVQRDDVSDSIYGAGILVSSFTDFGLDKSLFEVDKKPEGKIFGYRKVLVAETLGDSRKVVQGLLLRIYAVLKACANYNEGVRRKQRESAAAGKPGGELSLQGYCMDRYEASDLEDALMEELLLSTSQEDLSDPVYRNKLLEILFWIHGERALTGVREQSDHMGMEFPIVVISEAVRTLYSIPAAICYDMKSVCETLLQSYNGGEIYQKIERYHYRLNNKLKSEVINDVWSGQALDKQRAIHGLVTQLQIRMNLENRLIWGMRKSHPDIFKRYPEKYYLHSQNLSMGELPSRLWTEYQYEELKKYHEIRSVRMNDLEEMASEGCIMKLSLIDVRQVTEFGRVVNVIRFWLLNGDSFFANGFFWGILVRIGETGITNLRKLSKNAEQNLKAGEELYAASEIRFGFYPGAEGKRPSGRLVQCKCFGREKNFEKGQEYYLVESYKNLNERKIWDALMAESKRTPPLLRPETYYGGCLARLPREGRETGKVVEIGTGTDLGIDLGADLGVDLGTAAGKGTAVNALPRVTNEDLKECLRYRPKEKGADFTQSQKRAFEQLFMKNITLLLGPPGTGKTDFIARAVLTLCRYYEGKGVYLRVLLSANSHSAINNMLEKIREKLEHEKAELEKAEGEKANRENVDLGNGHQEKEEREREGGKSLGGGISLYKINKWGDATEQPVEGVQLADKYEKQNIHEVFEPKPIPVVAGSSCWQVMKAVDEYNQYSGNAFRGFDLIIIDEASQMRTMDALLSLQAGLGNPYTRYLIVGDEDQLPPIISGKYDGGEEAVDIYGSIFRLYYDTAKAFGLDYMVQLQEQFRMNEILSRYSAVSIYHQGYQAFDFARGKEGRIATQELTLKGRVGDELTSLLLEPAYPLVVCRIHGGDAFEKRDQEIRLVTAVVGALKEHMCVPGTQMLYDAESFWGGSNSEGALGIISPHHEQINRLKDSISQQLGEAREKIYIGTVDKLQGRQREAVIVSYGVTDPERAAGEMEFIYSRNRLNVALTRGKKKVICILSDTLLDKSIETLSVEDEDTLKGITYMTSLIDFMKEEGEDEKADIRLDWNLGNVKVDIFRKKYMPPA